MRMLSRQVERYVREPIPVSFEALMFVGVVDTLSGKGESYLMRFFVAPYGRRWERADTGEIHIAKHEEGVLKVWRLDPQSRIASLESKEAVKPHSERAKRPSRVETYRGFRCAVEKAVERSAELVVEAQEWRVLEPKAQNWLLRLELQMYMGQQRVGVSLWDTLEIQFKDLSPQLFTIPSEYRVLP